MQFAVLRCASDRWSGGRRLDPHFLQIGHELISKIILSLMLIQEGQFSVSGKRICAQILVNHLED